MKEQVRIGKVNVSVLMPRCKKSKREFIEAVGTNDLQVLEALEIKVLLLIGKAKSYEIEKIVIFDGEREVTPTHTMLGYDVFNPKNRIHYSIDELLTSIDKKEVA